MASLPVLISLIVLKGDLPDPDRNAHDMWVNQFLENGSLVISEEGVFDNWNLYYPNTVPKPVELLISIFRASGQTFYQALVTYIIALITIISVWYASGKKNTGLYAALFLGLNPIFILLTLRGNPAIPFLCGMFLLQSKNITSSSFGAILASFSRPEGFIYGSYHCLKNKKWKLLIVLAVTGIIWLVFHKLTCGSFLWAANEVKYSVAAMAYPTTNSITFLPWVILRLILVMGAPATAILLLTFKKWNLSTPFVLNFILLAVSLAAGSLVLPRYIDQLFLLSTPFIVSQVSKLYFGKAKTLAITILIASTQLAWIEVIPELNNFLDLRKTYNTIQIQENQITAVNELLIPGICLANNISNPIGRFISVDKAAWENASETDLVEFGVTDILIIPYGMFFPEHTKEWLNSIEIDVTYF